MKKICAAMGFALGALAGCSGTNGIYVPACAMFEGQSITLDGGRFAVDRFTDSVDVDDAGNTIDPFPGYPIQGDYRIEGNVLFMRSDSGTNLPTYYFAEVGNKKWLLTEPEYEEWTRDGAVGPCSLSRDGRSPK